MKPNPIPAAAAGLRTNAAKPASKLIQPKLVDADKPRLKIETAAPTPKPTPIPAKN